jgi:2-(1,2-epoxy-1,2-dihydrophenyl)acetyl-CoA isomerase
LREIVKYKQEGAVAVITLHRPESMNSFDADLRAETCNAFTRAHNDETVRVVIFTGEGRCFSAGADLKAGIDRDVTEILMKEYRPVQEATFRSRSLPRYRALLRALECRWHCNAT